MLVRAGFLLVAISIKFMLAASSLFPFRTSYRYRTARANELLRLRFVRVMEIFFMLHRISSRHSMLLFMLSKRSENIFLLPQSDASLPGYSYKKFICKMRHRIDGISAHESSNGNRILCLKGLAPLAVVLPSGASRRASKLRDQRSSDRAYSIATSDA